MYVQHTLNSNNALVEFNVCWKKILYYTSYNTNKIHDFLWGTQFLHEVNLVYFCTVILYRIHFCFYIYTKNTHRLYQSVFNHSLKYDMTGFFHTMLVKIGNKKRVLSSISICNHLNEKNGKCLIIFILSVSVTWRSFPRTIAVICY